MKIKLTRKLGQNKAGALLDRSAPEAEQLIRQGFAIHAPDAEAQAAEQRAAEDTDDDTTQQDGTGEQTTEPGDNSQQGEPTAADLKAHAELLQIPTSGNKKQLAERIEQHIATHGDQPAPTA